MFFFVQLMITYVLEMLDKCDKIVTKTKILPLHFYLGRNVYVRNMIIIQGEHAYYSSCDKHF